MRQQADSSHTRNNSALIAQNRASADAITQYKVAEQSRWKKKVISFIFIGALISLLVHIIIGFLLTFLSRGVYEDHSEVVATTLEFAIEDATSLTEIPEGQLLKHKSAQTGAASDSFETTQATMTADVDASSLDVSSESMAPSLAGAFDGGGGVIGGSGGATSFFGISSYGSRFCYIVDISSSMNSHDRLISAIDELTKSLEELPDFAYFYILFYSDRVREPSIQIGWNVANASTIRRMIKEFESFDASGGTYPKPAFEQAFKLDPLPEVIYFLTDGKMQDFTAETFKMLKPKNSKVVVNTIDFSSLKGNEDLEEIAKITGGKYKFVESKGK